jgi:hypothetical protein
VRRAAADDFQTARWADAIEKAVFGGGEVDARTEGEIDRMAPPEPNVQPARAPEKNEAKPVLAVAERDEEDERR